MTKRKETLLAGLLGFLSALVVTVTLLQGCSSSYTETHSAGDHWEFVSSGGFKIRGNKFHSITLRMPVKGGWLYRVTTGKNNTLAFVSDNKVKLVLPSAEEE